MYDKKNIFAKVISKDLPADVIFEDDKLMAFHDKFPVAPIHALVIPKGAFTDYSHFIRESSKENIAYFFTKLYEIANQLCGTDFRICSNNGGRSGQTIFHFHMHIIGGRDLGAIG